MSPPLSDAALKRRDILWLVAGGLGVCVIFCAVVYGIFFGPVRDRGQALRVQSDALALSEALHLDEAVSVDQAMRIYDRLGGWGTLRTDARAQGLCAEVCPSWYVEYAITPKACAQATQTVHALWPVQSRGGSAFTSSRSSKANTLECLDPVVSDAPLRLAYFPLVSDN